MPAPAPTNPAPAKKPPAAPENAKKFDLTEMVILVMLSLLDDAVVFIADLAALLPAIGLLMVGQAQLFNAVIYAVILFWSVMKTGAFGAPGIIQTVSWVIESLGLPGLRTVSTVITIVMVNNPKLAKYATMIGAAAATGGTGAAAEAGAVGATEAGAVTAESAATAEKAATAEGRIGTRGVEAETKKDADRVAGGEESEGQEKKKEGDSSVSDEELGESKTPEEEIEKENFPGEQEMEDEAGKRVPSGGGEDVDEDSRGEEYNQDEDEDDEEESVRRGTEEGSPPPRTPPRPVTVQGNKVILSPGNKTKGKHRQKPPVIQFPSPDKDTVKKKLQEKIDEEMEGLKKAA